METGSGRAVEVSPFHSHGVLKGFVISGRWPDSTKEWAQLLMVAVRVASLPGLLSTTYSGRVKNSRMLPPPAPSGWCWRRGRLSVNLRCSRGNSPSTSRPRC